MNRRGLFITGTDTGVGKTSVTAGIAAVLREGIPNAEGHSFGNVKVWKPVQTGTSSAEAPDADSYRLRKEGGLSQPERDIATITLPDPLAPWMAARRVGETIDYDALLAEGRGRIRHGDFVLVEGAGGLAVPLTERHLIADLAAGLDLPLLIVARSGLGTVNHALLTVAAAKQFGIRIAGIVLNGCKENELAAIEENVEMIERFSGTPVVGLLPWFEAMEEEDVQSDDLLNGSPRWSGIVRSVMDWDTILQLQL